MLRGVISVQVFVSKWNSIDISGALRSGCISTGVKEWTSWRTDGRRITDQSRFPVCSHQMKWNQIHATHHAELMLAMMVVTGWQGLILLMVMVQNGTEFCQWFFGLQTPGI